LQLELSVEIDEAISKTKQKLFENFDDEVREKLKVRDEAAKVYLDRFETLFMRLTAHELADHAEFIDGSSFRLSARPPWIGEVDVPLGLYELPRRTGEAHLFRMGHPLGEAVVSRAKGRELSPAEVEFDYTGHPGKISLVEGLLGKSGWLTASLLTVDALDQVEDHVLLAGQHYDGSALDEQTLQRLIALPARVLKDITVPAFARSALDAALEDRKGLLLRNVTERNLRYFEIETDKLDGWADDLKLGLEREIKEIDRQIKEARRDASTALTLETKLAAQKQIKGLEAHRNQKRRTLFEAQDEIDRKRTELISQIEAKLGQKVKLECLFIACWRVR
jgi:adenine-specific DNA-methyltransferase